MRYIRRTGEARRWHTIGKTDAIELGDAMATARELMAALQLTGADPRDEQRAPPPSTANTINDIYELWIANPSRKQALRARTREEYARIFRLHVQPHIGHVGISDLTTSSLPGSST